ncbi:16S rRNA (uracil(1498)-N(3))-methyltransferase [Cohaesibacter celericrescens]|uniref:Ribosomal RNA small subunit methyltransferase E n=1 Tax=Cohaesibacter celericrescens TaxID=2067669 RepID=A0A2N5XKI5_9HYPH|nr:16S rRNA (uracil(1498)-N(3))-methyltransferase [Cohaesibacter celericrescens]PLW74985.1 16S rRNA (uracil(1498)-N(3))-methyltransferase [Cohaesibacter celericrescens]
MSHYDFKSQRLWVEQDIAEKIAIPCDRAQSNYLLNVLRMDEGDEMLIFNGRDGEWKVEVRPLGRKKCVLVPIEQLRSQPVPNASDLHYLFAPLKSARIDYMAQKAVEMGASQLRPVFTQHTQERRPKLDKMRSNVIEAAEQCGILAIPDVTEPVTLSKLLESWEDGEDGRHIIFCDEGELGKNPLAILDSLRGEGRSVPPLALLVGPEGGFSEPEREQLRAATFVTPIPLGPRILRADTAAVAAMAIVQAVLGDWTGE